MNYHIPDRVVDRAIKVSRCNVGGCTYARSTEYYEERLVKVAAAKSDLVGEREVMEVTEIQKVTSSYLYTTTPSTIPRNNREIVVVVINHLLQHDPHSYPTRNDESTL